MMTWVLILFAHAGPMSKGDSMAITSVVPAFTTLAACEAARKKAEDLARNTVKEIRGVCVEHPR